jgi:hypothetical protein
MRAYGSVGLALLIAANVGTVVPAHAASVPRPHLQVRDYARAERHLPAASSTSFVLAPSGDGRSAVARLRAAGARVVPVPSTGYWQVRSTASRLLGLERLARADGATVEADAVVTAASVEPPRVEPNDPAWSQQASMGTVRADFAWGVPLGHATPMLAVVDTGVAPDTDFAGRLLGGHNFVTGSDDTSDPNGHGTLVAGIAAAAGNNGVGIAGVAWTAPVLPVTVLDSNGAGTAAGVASGIGYAVSRGAGVIVLATQTTSDSPVLKQAVADAISHGVVVVSAGGNFGDSTPVYPAAYPGVIAVAAVDTSYDSGAPASTVFSSNGAWISLSAPGVAIPSDLPGNQIGAATGTSFSAAFVAGAALLVRAKYPSLSPAQVKDRLVSTAFDNVGPPGWDPRTGAGDLDIFGALGGTPSAAGQSQPATDEAAPTDDNPSGANPLTLSSASQGRISPDGDADWYRIDVPAGSYTATVTAQPPAGTSNLFLVPRLQVFDGALTTVGDASAPPPSLSEWEGSGYTSGRDALTFVAKAAGTFYLRVTNVVGTQSPKTYDVEVASGATAEQRPVQFTGYAHYPALPGLRDAQVVTADVTGDGRPDAIVPAQVTTTPTETADLLVYPQSPSGALADPVVLPTDQGRSRNIDSELPVATGDLNHDGRPDVVVGTGEGLDLYTDTSTGLSQPTFVTLPGPATFVAVADLNADGRPDIVSETAPVTVNGQSFVGGVYQSLQNASGGFATTQIASDVFQSVAVGDVNGDGRPDVVGYLSQLQSNNNPGYLVVLRNGGNAGWTRVPYSSPLGPLMGLAVGDINGDGTGDVVATGGGNAPDAYLAVWSGSSSGLTGPAQTATRDTPYPVILADLNGDGLPDVVTTNDSFGLAFHLQQPGGGLGVVHGYDAPAPTANGFGAIAADDVTGDGTTDLVATDDVGGIDVLAGEPPETPVGLPTWIRATNPGGDLDGVPTTVQPSVTFARTMNAATIDADSIRLLDGRTRSPIGGSVSFDPSTATAIIAPTASLKPGWPYAVELTDTVADSAGRHPAGRLLPFVTAGSTTPPGAPTSVTAAAGPGGAKATVKWSPPSANGSDPPVAYTVSALPAGPIETVPATQTSATITGLQPGASYHFEVEPTNHTGGFGAWSADSNTITATQPTLPGSPRSVLARLADRTATVSWQPPSDPGGSSIEQYVVTQYPGGVRETATGLSVSFTGLRYGTTYSYTVAAVNADGMGTATASNAVRCNLTVVTRLTSAGYPYSRTSAQTTWTALGGTFLAPPAVAIDASGHTYYLGEERGGLLAVRSSRSGWHVASRAVCGDPAIAAGGGKLYVACRSSAGHLWVAAASISQGSLPYYGAFTDLGGQLAAGPAVAMAGQTPRYLVVGRAFDSAGHDTYVRTSASGYQRVALACVGHPALAVAATTVVYACTDRSGKRLDRMTITGRRVQTTALAMSIAPGVGVALDSDGITATVYAASPAGAILAVDALTNRVAQLSATPSPGVRASELVS